MSTGTINKLGASSAAAAAAPAVDRFSREDGYKRNFARPFVLALACLLAAVAALNYIVNPRTFYGTRLVEPLVWNARAIKARLLLQMNPKPEALILGSSRTWKIDPAKVEQATGLRTFNFGVDAGTADDYYLATRYAVEKAGAQPKLLIIGVDLEAFHNNRERNNAGVDYRVVQAGPFGEFMPWRDRVYARWTAFTNLFVLQQTELSFRSLRLNIPRLLHHRQQSEGMYDVAPNGYVHFTKFEAERSRGHYDLESKIQADVPDYKRKFSTYTAISPEKLAYFERTLQYARDHGMQVMVFISPIHAHMEQALVQSGYYQKKAEVIRTVRQVCASHGIPLQDFSDISSFGGDPDGFLDGVHIDEHNSALMVEKMFAKEAHAIQ